MVENKVMEKGRPAGATSYVRAPLQNSRHHTGASDRLSYSDHLSPTATEEVLNGGAQPTARSICP